jgi:hypothetical protein
MPASSIGTTAPRPKRRGVAQALAAIALSMSLAYAARAQVTERHHQPSQAEVNELLQAKPALAPTARPRIEDADNRFLAACDTRIRLDVPLGAQGSHSAFCACWLGALHQASAVRGVALVAENLEKRNAPAPYWPALPTDVDRSNEAAINQCLPELAR